jgi:hypothetical protein
MDTLPLELLTNILVKVAPCQTTCKAFAAAMASPDAVAASLVVARRSDALRHAVTHGKFDVVQALLVGDGRERLLLRPDIMVPLATSIELNAAVRHGHIEVVELLIDHGAVLLRGHYIEAAQLERTDMLRLFLRRTRRCVQTTCEP